MNVEMPIMAWVAVPFRLSDHHYRKLQSLGYILITFFGPAESQTGGLYMLEFI